MSSSKNKPVIFSALEVANICGVVNQTAINWIRQNHLEAFKTPGGQYRVYLEDLLKFMNSQNMRIPEKLAQYASASVKKALIIEQSLGLGNVIAGELSREFQNIENFVTTDAFTAGTVFANNKPDVIIFDEATMQSNIDSLFAQIELSGYAKKPTIIQITSSKKSASKKEGVFTLPKPIDLVELVKIIKEN